MIDKRWASLKVVGAVVGAIVVTGVGHTISIFLASSPVRRLPGPWLAKLTNLYRLFVVWTGRASAIQQRLHRQYGDIICLGPKLVSIGSPDLIRPIYSNRAMTKSDFYKSCDIRIGDRRIVTTLSCQDEIAHSAMSRPVNRFFSTVSSVLKYEGRMDASINNFLEMLKSRFAKERAVCPIHLWLGFLAWDLMGQCTYSSEFGFLTSGQDVSGLVESDCKATRYLSVVGQIPILDYLFDKNPIYRTGPDSFVAVSFFAEKAVQMRISGEDKHDPTLSHDFLDDYLEVKRLNDAVTEQDVVGWLRRNLVAGSVKVAVAIRAIIYYTVKHPHVHRKLCEEMAKAGLLDGATSYEEISQLPYLDAVIRESLRIHPPIALILERLVPDAGYTLPDGTHLPGGTIVGINAAVIGMHKPTFGEDADLFRPERWLRAEGEAEDLYTHRVARMRDADFAFGFGKRSCAGRSLATIIVTKAAAAFFQTFDVRLVDPLREWTTFAGWSYEQWDMDVYLTTR